MPVVKVKDDHGKTMTLREVDGFYLPVIRVPYDQEKEFRDRTDWTARSDDVLICAYPKSGTHWVWEITCMLLNGNAERINLMKEMAMLECLSRSALDSMTSPRVLNTHMYYGQIPEDFKRKQCKIVYILRNPRDVAVSFFNHHTRLLDYEYSGDWQQYLPRFIEGKVDYGSWFDYVVDWEASMNRNQQNPAHVVTYEDLQKDSVNEVSRLASFLKTEGTETLYKEIAKQCNFQKMKKEKDPLEDTAEWKDDKPGMYRKGIVGDWKNWFTVAQSEVFNAVYKERLASVTLPVPYTI
ncbi:sulfotransferase family cytosolic 1B member 1-like [Pecten maximus]|uniref:sulfotransferase family cytosolic 1B member 1-like n=1 Tax=Pecten maximus TaxID=6579 RepID=UPI001458F971|nr:sulfotransferase family cytosolic 1B member 1-like [Pecten maximus]XP_033748046.1 sulfotransferase family cytosolic 1B member 1-like [Pecten maximus]